MPNWYSPSPASQIRPVPWLAPVVIDYIEAILRPEYNVIEHGGGGSTLWFAERVNHVTCYETDRKWLDAISHKDRQNITLRDVPLPLESVDNEKDLMLIDGVPLENRGKWIRCAPRIVKAGGWVILDNSNRPEYAQDHNSLQDFATLEFVSDVIGKHLVTEIWRVNNA